MSIRNLYDKILLEAAKPHMVAIFLKMIIISS